MNNMDNTLLYKEINKNIGTTNDAIESIIQNAYTVGQSTLIAYLLDSIHVKSYTLEEITQFLYGLMKEDVETKDYVYEQMKNIK